MVLTSACVLVCQNPMGVCFKLLRRPRVPWVLLVASEEELLSLDSVIN